MGLNLGRPNVNLAFPHGSLAKKSRHWPVFFISSSIITKSIDLPDVNTLRCSTTFSTARSRKFSRNSGYFLNESPSWKRGPDLASCFKKTLSNKKIEAIKLFSNSRSKNVKHH